MCGYEPLCFTHVLRVLWAHRQTWVPVHSLSFSIQVTSGLSFLICKMDIAIPTSKLLVGFFEIVFRTFLAHSRCSLNVGSLTLSSH